MKKQEVINDFWDISTSNKIPIYIKQYLRVPIYIHIIVCFIMTISLLCLIYYLSYINFSNKTLKLKAQESYLKQQIKSYYEINLDIQHKQNCINQFVDNNTIRKMDQSKLLSDVRNIANNNDVTVISVVPNSVAEPNSFSLSYNNNNITVTICYLAITVSSSDSNKLINFVNNLLNQKYINVVNKFEVIKQGNGILHGFLLIESYCL
jgi:hypothetical protein